jgi:hypothetical protein
MAEPGQELPVAAGPAVTTAHLDRVGRRIVLEEQDVADQPRARVRALEQIMAEDPVLGELAADRPLEGVDVVDALADEGALVEDVLVDVGDRAGVGVDAWLAGEEAGEAGAAGR